MCIYVLSCCLFTQMYISIYVMVCFHYRLLTLLYIGSDARHTKDLTSHRSSKAIISSNTFILYAVCNRMKSIYLSLHMDIIRLPENL